MSDCKTCGGIILPASEQDEHELCTKARSELAAPAGSARAWQCDLGNGEWDHDWQEYFESSGEVDGGPGDHWSYSVCLACGAIKEEAQNAGTEPLPPEAGVADKTTL